MKPPSKKRRYPVASFGPEIMAALVKGSTERVVLKFPTNAAATQFQHRVHTLRSMMREENHPNTALVARARCSRVWGAKLADLHPNDSEMKQYENDHRGQRCCHLVIQPNDIQFAAILKEAGVEVAPPEIIDPPVDTGALNEMIVPSDPYKEFKEP